MSTFEENHKPMSTHAKHRGKSDTRDADDVINNGAHRYEPSSASTSAHRKSNIRNTPSEHAQESISEKTPDQDKGIFEKAAQLGQMAKEKIKEGLGAVTSATAATREKVGEKLSSVTESLRDSTTSSSSFSATSTPSTSSFKSSVDNDTIGVSKTIGEKKHDVPSKSDMENRHHDVKRKTAEGKVVEGLSNFGNNVNPDQGLQTTELPSKNPFNISSVKMSQGAVANKKSEDQANLPLDKLPGADYAVFKDIDKTGVADSLDHYPIDAEDRAKGPEEAAPPGFTQGAFVAAQEHSERKGASRAKKIVKDKKEQLGVTLTPKQEEEVKKSGSYYDMNLNTMKGSSTASASSTKDSTSMHRATDSGVTAASKASLLMSRYPDMELELGASIKTSTDDSSSQSATGLGASTMGARSHSSTRPEQTNAKSKDMNTSSQQGSTDQRPNWEKLNESGDYAKQGKNDPSNTNTSDYHKRNLQNPQKGDIGSVKEQEKPNLQGSIASPKEKTADERSVSGQYAQANNIRDKDLPSSGDQWKPL
jgi:hypothetical protein